MENTYQKSMNFLKIIFRIMGTYKQIVCMEREILNNPPAPHG